VQRFAARVSKNDSGGHTAVVPFDPKAAFGIVRAPVRATVNGYTFRTRLARYGGIDYIGFNREVREAAGIAAGDLLEIELELDEEPRTVEVPDELAAALAADTDARATFEALAPSHRRELAGWVAEAKRADTKARRVERALERLHEPAEGTQRAEAG
jgi:hypothetical protein